MYRTLLSFLKIISDIKNYLLQPFFSGKRQPANFSLKINQKF